MAARRRTISQFHDWRVDFSNEVFSIATHETCILSFWEYVLGKVLIFKIRVNDLVSSNCTMVSGLTASIALTNLEFEIVGASEWAWLEWVADLPVGTTSTSSP